MKDDESIPEMFYRLQVIVNDLKSLGEDVKDKDFSHKFLMNLPKKFAILRKMIQREGLDKVTPNQVLGDVMTDVQYDDDEDEDEKKEIKVKQEKTTAFKASSSKGKNKVIDDDDPFDEETMALLVQNMGRFMKKRGYGAMKRRDYMKAKEMLCYNCKSPDHVVAECPYEDKRFNDGKLKLKKNKKDKKEKKVKRNFTINKKKKGGGFIVTWDSDVSDESDDDDIASITISNKPSLFETTSTYLMAKPTKVQYHDMMMTLVLVMVVGVTMMMRTTPRMNLWTSSTK
jgi:hypothetical protein